MSQNCKIKSIVFVVTLNKVNNELCLHINSKRFIPITKIHLEYYMENYIVLAQSCMLGKIWHFKSKTN